MDKYQRIFWCIIAILLCVIGAIVVVSKQATAESAATPLYDTTDLDYRETQSTCRMIGGWYHSKDVIETADGRLWNVNTDGINEYEFLLVWFDTMDTQEKDDDRIVKMWREVY